MNTTSTHVGLADPGSLHEASSTARSENSRQQGNRRLNGCRQKDGIQRAVPLVLEMPAPAERFCDAKVWDMISRGDARAVHHIESPAMLSLAKMCNVRDIDTLIAVVSVIRPGAANESKKVRFTRRHQGLEPVEYPHPSLEQVLKGTYGLVVYEEHILQICEVFAGMSAGRGDILRRALVKNKQAGILEMQKEFVASARKTGRTEKAIEDVWTLVTGFSGYAFCKAHSTAYGVEAYQAAWLKRYFPAEFMAGVLSNGKGFYDPLVYMLECHRLGLRILPATINQPGPGFMPQHDGRSIRVPICRVKGLSDSLVEKILKEHSQGPFSSMRDFFYRVQPGMSDLQLLIRAGGFDEFGQPRTRQMWEAQLLYKEEDHTGTGQRWLIPPAGLKDLTEIGLREPTRLETLQWESELFGFPVNGHPLDLYPNIAWDTYCPVSELANYAGEEIITCGLVIEQRTHHQVTGEPMKFLTLADYTGIVETELFAETYKHHGLATVRYPVLEITATVESFENSRGYTLRVHRANKPREIPRMDKNRTPYPKVDG